MLIGEATGVHSRPEAFEWIVGLPHQEHHIDYIVHAHTMARPPAQAKSQSRWPNFKLTHYPEHGVQGERDRVPLVPPL